MIKDHRKEDPNRAKEVKVKIPVGYHIKLHSMKVLTGKPISDAVTEALEAYFATRDFDLGRMTAEITEPGAMFAGLDDAP